MKKQLSRLLVLFITCWALNSCISTQPSPESVKIKTRSEVSVGRYSSSVVGSIEQEPITATITFREYKGSERHWLGTDGGVPELIIDSLVVTRSGKILDIPNHLYSDFSDFDVRENSLELYSNKDGFYLTFLGSDGAGSYSGTFYFDQDGLYRVSIGHLGMSKNNVLEWVTTDRCSRQNNSCHTTSYKAQ